MNREELKNILDEKDIYKLLNEVNIDGEEFEDIDLNIDEIRIRKLKKNLRKDLGVKRLSKKAKYALSIAGGVIICIAWIGIMSVKNPAFAKEIPVLNSIVQRLIENYGYKGDYETYAEVIGQTQYDKGISITLNEVVYDESEVIITYTIKSDKKIEELGENFISNLYESIKINGSFSGFSGASSTSEQIDEHTMIAFVEYQMGLEKLPDKFDMDINIKEIFDIKGKWKFSFKLSKEEILKEQKTFDVDIVKNFEGTDVRISKVSFSPLSTNIKLDGKKYENMNDLNSHFGFFEYDYWLLFDDNGNEIGRRENMSGGGSHESFESTYRYDAVDKVPKYLTVVPVQFRIREEFGLHEDGKKSVRKNKKEYITKDVKKLINGSYPIELKQGRFGKLTIIGMEETEDKTIIRYKAEGKLPYFQGHQLYIENEAGEKLEVKINPINNGYNNKEFTIEVEKLKSNEKYYFVTSNLNNRDFKEDYVFKIPIK
ncbi:hypothetical protein Curi_c24870 [Gottschalkia acidurici 9a]|uniref:DUF4179 domain-containing protein n=1 Tax=Gottschalkia acidurici (strain ATCC 7906 / DSM 604 / BCRC 14475 / CIP 104303 / KCTC 5404 / NCIMB 10678 / 9a) TaxID=1128398 RepID=K0B2V7_GOTA9|nr:DUF4179 domain-containing protein [Gottschalkia acidurici]AFS79482.1 hypothetical protein Curi_c24870 [Gottschalkia acidurici 9a]